MAFFFFTSAQSRFLKRSWDVFAFLPGHEQTQKVRGGPEKGGTSRSMSSDLEALGAGVLSGPFPSAENASSDSGPHRRSKRFLSYPRFVEVMVVADSKMVEHHGSNLQHYILTLMSIVSGHKSLPSFRSTALWGWTVLGEKSHCITFLTSWDWKCVAILVDWWPFQGVSPLFTLWVLG